MLSRVAQTIPKTVRAVPAVQRRNMGGPAAPIPTEGWEGAVRAKLPHNYQIALAVLGGYTGLILFGKMISGGKKEEEVAQPANTSGSDKIHSITEEEWADWVKDPNNMAKWEASLEKDE